MPFKNSTLISVFIRTSLDGHTHPISIPDLNALIRSAKAEALAILLRHARSDDPLQSRLAATQMLRLREIPEPRPQRLEPAKPPLPRRATDFGSVKSVFLTTRLAPPTQRRPRHAPPPPLPPLSPKTPRTPRPLKSLGPVSLSPAIMNTLARIRTPRPARRTRVARAVRGMGVMLREAGEVREGATPAPIRSPVSQSRAPAPPTSTRAPAPLVPRTPRAHQSQPPAADKLVTQKTPPSLPGGVICSLSVSSTQHISILRRRDESARPARPTSAVTCRSSSPTSPRESSFRRQSSRITRPRGGKQPCAQSRSGFRACSLPCLRCLAQRERQLPKQRLGICSPTSP